MIIRPTDSFESSRMFSISGPSDYYKSLVEAVFQDFTVRKGGLIIPTSVNLIVGATASADCEIVSVDEIAESILLIDESLIEIIHLVIGLSVPKFNYLPKIASEALVDRIVFHGVMRSARYDLLELIPPTKSPTMVAGRIAISGKIALRLVLGVEAIIAHEMGHWKEMAGYGFPTLSQGLRKRIEENALQGFDRMAVKSRLRYDGVDVEAGVNMGKNSLDYWFKEGWSELACDIDAIFHSIKSAKQLKIPIASFVVVITIIFQLLAVITLVSKTFEDEEDWEKLAGRDLARQIILQTIIQDLEETIGISNNDWSLAVKLRSRANRRFVDSIAVPAIDRAERLSKSGTPRTVPARARLLALVREHGFGPTPVGKLSFFRPSVRLEEIPEKASGYHWTS